MKCDKCGSKKKFCLRGCNDYDTVADYWETIE